MMMLIYLLCLLLAQSFYAPAQIKSEISYWVRKHAFSSALVKMHTTVTLWNGSLPAETLEYSGEKPDQHTLHRADGPPAETRTYLYNPDTVLTRIVYPYNEHAEKVIRTFVYSLDEQGDWTSQKIYEQRFIYDPRFVGEYRKTRPQ